MEAAVPFSAFRAEFLVVSPRKAACREESATRVEALLMGERTHLDFWAHLNGTICS